MKIVEFLKRAARRLGALGPAAPRSSVDLLGEIAASSSKTAAGVDGQARLLNDKLAAVIVGLDNQSRLLNEHLGGLVANSDKQLGLLRALIDRQDALLELHKDQIAASRRRVRDQAQVSERNWAYRYPSIYPGERGQWRCSGHVYLLQGSGRGSRIC